MKAFIVTTAEQTAPRPRILSVFFRLNFALVLVVMAVQVAALRRADLARSGQQVIVIPAGTAERLAAGEVTDAAPHRIALALDQYDTLVIRNEDSVWHQIGPYRVAPGQTLVSDITPGTQIGYCSITPSRRVQIVAR